MKQRERRELIQKLKIETLIKKMMPELAKFYKGKEEENVMEHQQPNQIE